jgi:hypothetical protein
MTRVKCLFVVVIIILIIVIIIPYDDGFRSHQEKRRIASELIADGQPTFEAFRKKGLDGVEYYDSKQLWNRRKYNMRNVTSIL